MLRDSMREKPALQSQFDALLADRQDLRAMFAAEPSTGPRRSNDFAARVLAESHRRGLQTGGVHSSGGNIEVPAVRRREQRREQPHSAPKKSRLSLAIGLVTAAAVLLVVSLTVRKGQLGDDRLAIAQHQPAAQPTPELPTASDRRERTEPEGVDIASTAIESSANSADPTSEPMIAAADRAAATPDVP